MVAGLEDRRQGDASGRPGHRAAARYRRQEDNPWVISGSKPGSPLSDLNYYWQHIRKWDCLDGVRIHDLRQSYASGDLLVGEGLPMIGKLPGHDHVHTTALYVHLVNDPLKSAASRISNRIAEVAG